MSGDGARRPLAGSDVVLLARVRRPRTVPEPTRLLGSVVEALLPEEAGADAPRVARVTRFVHLQLAALPLVLRALLRAGLLGFRVLTAIRHARGFCSLDLVTRRRVVRAWSFGPVAPARQLFRVLRSPALLAWYDLPATADGARA